MAEVSVSLVVERVRALVEEQNNEEVQLLRGAEKDLILSISEILTTLSSVLYNAERRRYEEDSVEDWVSHLERTCRELEDVLDDWDFALLKIKRETDTALVAPYYKQKVRSFTTSPSCLYFTKFGVRRNFAKKIRILKAQLDLISGERDQYKFVIYETARREGGQTTSLISFDDEIYGRDDDGEFLVDKLVSQHESSGLQVLSVVGVGGIGKTTLAQLVYNDTRVEACFELRIWVCATDASDWVGIANLIILTIRNVGNTNHSDLVFEQLTDCISGKKILLVFDDVWTSDFTKWELLKNSLGHGRAGSKILVTTRNERVAMMMATLDIFSLGLLSEEDCWLILHRTARPKGNMEENLEDIGRKIAIKCNGLPFVAKCLGSLLRFKLTLEEWESVLHEEIWELESEGYMPHFLRNVNQLSPILKHCLSFCGIFPEDSLIDVEKLIEMWIALGYLGSSAGSGSDMVRRGRENFAILKMQSLFEVEKSPNGQMKRCKMNSMVHDCAKYLRERRNVCLKKKPCHVCSPAVFSQVEVYRSLFWENDSPLKICNCLRSLRVLKMRCKRSSIPQGVENLISLRWLELSGKKLSREDAITVCKLYKLQFLRFYVQEIPREIENFVQLTLLDLSFNDCLEELPESICNLHELLTLNISFCRKLSKLPQGIHKLKKLKYLPNVGTSCLKQFPEGVAEMSELRTLNEYCAGVGWSKLGWLKGLRQLRGFLSLKIRLAVGDDLAEVASEAQQANLMGKKQIEDLQIIFEDEMGENEVIPRTHIIDALGAPENLQKLTIWFFKGSDLGRCIGWYLKKLTTINLYSFNHLSTLPPLGELSCLEEIYISEMHELKFVGQEFFGYAARWGKTVFPRLKELAFNHCPKWEVWEDISEEEAEDISEEEAEDVSIMPCLKKLTIAGCPRLKALPHRLLSKLSSSVEVNIICCSTNLQHYSAALWKSTSQQNPHAIASTSQLQQQTW